MSIKLAKYAGFCFGVKRAMEIAVETAKKNNKKIYTIGPLIHNDQAVKYLEEKKIISADVSEIENGSTVIIRTHGIPKQLYDNLKDFNIIDATCPFVKKIHKIVYENYSNGKQIIIVGNKNHPEVIGINGWCDNSAIIISSPDEISKINLNIPGCMVVQTTFSIDIWKKIKKIAKISCQSIDIFDTICNATEDRQLEAEKLSSQVETMIVIGGKHSSNTKKLVDICKRHCPDTYHIETASELPNETWSDRNTGVTAGASTPEWIIKEVISKMSEEKTMEVTDEISFAEELEKSLVSLRTGDIVKGVVIGVTPTEVYVDLGTKADGIIPAGELSNDPSVLPEDIVKVGDELDVFVVKINDVEGTIKLSKKKLDIIAGQKRMENAVESKEILEGKITEAVNGGVIVISNGIRVFVPARQAASKYIQDLNTIVGTTVKFRLIEFNPRRRKVVGSIKSVSDEIAAKKLEEFWSEAEIGKEYLGTVKSLTNFGAFVDIGGIDGLIHISELSWGRVKHPSDVLKVGDTVRVYILALDKENNKVSLGYRKAEDNPWEIIKTKIAVGDVINVKIVRIKSFGAFAEIIPNIDGLIHISQIANKHIDTVSSVLKVGDQVDVKVTEIDFENKKISLSMKALIEPEIPEEKPEDNIETVEKDSDETSVEAEDDKEKQSDEEVSFEE